MVRRDATGLPFDVAKRGSGDDGESAKVGLLGTIDALTVKLRPQLFGYQFLYELKPAVTRGRPVRG